MPTTEGGVTYLTADDVVAIHGRIAARFAAEGLPFGGGLLSRSGLESAVSQPRQSFGGVDLYPDLFAKAAALFRGIICGHVFADGNKRTGMEAGLVSLELNGREVRLTKDEYVGLALDIAGAGERGKEPIEVEEIAGRLKRGAKKAVR